MSTMRFPRSVFGAVILTALSFGTSQAFARATTIEEGEYCNPSVWTDFNACLQGCIAKYGENTQAQCARPRGGVQTVCQCIR
jgi:hypothetical protein